MATTKTKTIRKTYSKPENKTVYRQYDSRWGSLTYPDRKYTLARSGCGCCAITHCAMENPKYSKYTPKLVRKFMKKYAVAGKGTLVDGIPAGLKRYGYSDLIYAKIKGQDDLKPFWDALKDGKKGVLLFQGIKRDRSNKTPDGTVWTERGHFVAVVGYKVIGNKHYLYTKDSGRGHNGWYCYETSMKNSLTKAWLGTPPEIKKEK